MVRPLAGLVLAFFCLASLPAMATSSISLQWTRTSGAGSVGGTSITAANGDLLEATLFMNTDSAGVAAYSISLEFDRALDNELDIFAVQGIVPKGYMALGSNPLAQQESTSGNGGYVYSFAGITPIGRPGAVDATVAIGKVVFQVGDVSTDGSDVFAGNLNIGVDGIATNTGLVSFPAEVSLSVNGVSRATPEPTAALLFGVGFVLLAGARRH